MILYVLQWKHEGFDFIHGVFDSFESAANARTLAAKDRDTTEYDERFVITGHRLNRIPKTDSD